MTLLKTTNFFFFKKKPINSIKIDMFKSIDAKKVLKRDKKITQEIRTFLIIIIMF